MSSFGDLESLDVSEPEPGVTLRRLPSSKAIVKEYHFAPGSSFPLHWHRSEQITVVLEGSVEMSVGGEARSLEAGAWAVIAPNTEHGLTAGPAGARVLAVAPQRVSTVFRDY